MTLKARAPTIGHYRCPNPECGAWCAIRKQAKTGRLYGVCAQCGPTMWRADKGQEFFLAHGTMWGSAAPPDFLPAWIRNSECFPVTSKDQDFEVSTTIKELPPVSAPTVATQTLQPAGRTLPVEPAPAPAASDHQKSKTVKRSIWDKGIFS